MVIVNGKGGKISLSPLCKELIIIDKKNHSTHHKQLERKLNIIRTNCSINSYFEQKKNRIYTYQYIKEPSSNNTQTYNVHVCSPEATKQVYLHN